MRRISLQTIAVLAIILFVLVASVQFGFDQKIAQASGIKADYFRLCLNILAWAAGAVLMARLVEALGWNQVGRRSGRHAPLLLVQLTNIAIYLGACVGIASMVFDIPVTGAIATSSVIGLVIGFAVKSLISDTFSGIALNLDRGFAINDFIMIVGKPGTAKIFGQVTEINWRSTHLETPENSMLIIPNTVVSESIVLNLSRPEPASEFELLVTLDFDVSSERAVRVLNAAVNAAARENAAISDCKARISDLSTTGITYKIIYMLDPARLSPAKAKDAILRQVERQMKMTGLAVAHPKIDYWRRENLEIADSLGSIVNRVGLLKNIVLFQAFSESELASVAEGMSIHHFAPGTRIITVGDPGQSMFLLSEGLASVLIRGESDIEVATLRPGDFFGEMSLLTGEPRAATIMALTEAVAFEVDKENLMPLLDTNPNAAEMLANAAAERRLANATSATGQPEMITEERASLSSKILKGILRFFGLGDSKLKAANG